MRDLIGIAKCCSEGECEDVETYCRMLDVPALPHNAAAQAHWTATGLVVVVVVVVFGIVVRVSALCRAQPTSCLMTPIYQ